MFLRTQSNDNKTKGGCFEFNGCKFVNTKNLAEAWLMINREKNYVRLFYVFLN